jgi:hypothetical protein
MPLNDQSSRRQPEAGVAGEVNSVNAYDKHQAGAGRACAAALG